MRGKPGRRAFILVVACFALAAVAGASPVNTLDDILQLNAQSRGGAQALRSVHAIRLEVHLEEPTFTVTGTYVASRDGYVRVDVYAGEQRVFSEALGPKGGWQRHGGSDEILPLSPEGAAALERGRISNLYALFEWPQLGYRLALRPDSPDSHWVITATVPDGFQKQLWLDRGSHRIVRQYEISALHPDIDTTELEQYSETSDWNDATGVAIPSVTRRIERASGETLQVSRVLKVEILDADTAGTTSWAAPDYFLAPDMED